MRRPAGAISILWVVLALYSCGARGTVVEMLDNRYEPVEAAVAVGEEVTFLGAGRNPHNAVAADGSWSTESTFGALEQFEGDAATLTFDTPATYRFFCTFHGKADGYGMAGTLTVVATDPSP